MTEVTLASLAMDFDVAKAEPAKRQTDDLRASARALEEQAKATTQAVRDQAVAQGLAGTAAGKAEASMRSLVQVYSNAFNADRQYGMSQEATAKLLLQNARAADALAKEQDATARAVQRLTSAYDPLAGEVLKTNRQIAEADKLFKQGTISASQFGAVTDGLKQKIANLETAQATGVKSSKALQQATLNLGRQFTDIGVSLAGGQNLGLVLIQQLPQIADGFAVAKQQGMGFKAVVAGIAAEIAPFLPILAGLGAVAGVAFGGAALAARALNKDNKDLVDSLGLTEKQVKHLKDKGVETGVTIGDVFKGTFDYIKGAVAPALAPVMKWFDQLFDSITKGAVFTVKAIVGGFAGAFAGVKAIWSDLPAVMGDLFASGANLAISAIEKLLNFATAGINTLIDKANAVSAKVNGPQLGALGTFSLGRVDNPNAGAASKTADNAAVAVAEAYKKAGTGVDKVFADIGKSITKAAEDRIKKAAGDAGKTPKAKAEPRDMSEERSAQIAAQIEQALAEELRARLGMAKEISERAALERQIAHATASAKQSRVDAQIAGIADDKGLSDLKKAELTLELQRLKFIEGSIADLQVQEIRQKERAELFQRDLELAQAAATNQVDILNSRKVLAQSSYEASRIERQILDTTFAAERDRLSKIIANKDTDAKTLTESQGRLATIEEIHRNELRQLELSDNAVTAYADLVGALSNAAQAVIDGDIGGSISAAGGVLRQLSGLAGSGSSLGKSLATAASYAGPIGAAVSAVTGVLGAIGDRSAAKAAAKIERLTTAVENLRADNKTSSGSLAAALGIANSNWNADLEYSSAMLTALRSIDAKTGAVAALVARQVSTGGLLSTSGLGLGSSSTSGSLGAGLVAGGLTGAALAGGGSLLLSGLAGSLALGPIGLAAGAVGALVGALTKTKTTTEVLDQGLQFTAQTFDQITKGGVTGSSYADLLTTTKKSLLGVGLSTKVKTTTVSGAIDGDLLGQISGVIQALGDGVLSAAAVFGEQAAKAAESALGSAVVDLGKLSLKDLKPDEIADVLNATFDKVADQLAAAGVPGLDALADVGEGAFETLTRLAREYQVVDVALAGIGKTFGQVGLESIAARDDLVKLAGGIDALTSQTSFFATNFLTDAEQLAPVIKAVNDNLAKYGLSAESSREQFKNLVLAQDLTTESGRATYAALLAVAPAFDKVATAAEDKAALIAEAEAKAAEDRVAAAAKAQEATDKAYENATRGAAAYWDKVAAAGEEAAQRQAAAAQELSNSFADSVTKFEDFSKSLKAFAASLTGEALTGTAGGVGFARSSLINAVNKGDYENIQGLTRSYLDAYKDRASSLSDYEAQVRWVQQLVMAASAKAKDRASSVASVFQNLPKFATGGSMVINGNGGVDQNLISVNGVPTAWANQAEVMSFTPAGQQAGNDNSTAAAIRELKAEVVALRQQLANVEKNTGKTADNTGEARTVLQGVASGAVIVSTEAA